MNYEFTALTKQMRLKSKKCTIKYLWIIENFNLHHSRLKSPIFCAENDTLQCFLELDPGRLINANKAEDALNLKLKVTEDTLENEKNKGSISGLLKVTIYNLDEETYFCSERKQIQYYFRNEIIADFKKLTKRSSLNASELSKELRLGCKLSYIRLNNSIQDSNIITIPTKLPESDDIDIEKFFNNETGSDFAIYVGSKKYPAHKFVLAARSPVFESMFSHKDMQENKQNRINIEDFDEKTVERMLSYMYSGRMNLTDTESVFHLLRIADKYGVEKLRVRCEIEIHKLLSVKTVAKILLLSETCNFSTLKKLSIDFIKKHAAEVKKSKYWKEIITSHPDLLPDLLIDMLES